MTDVSRIAVIDIGKTNAKVVVLDARSSTELASRRAPNRSIDSAPYLHFDTEALWAFIAGALRELAVNPGYDVISITTHGASLVLLDADGALALPMIDYEAIYPEAIRAAYAELRPPFSETFSPSLPGGLNAGAQVHYQQTVFPEEFARVATIITYPQYWAFRLTGVAANEKTSLGCHTDLWNIAGNCYSSLVDRLGIRGLMAPIASAFDCLGQTTEAVSAELGLARPISVHCGIHDSNASLLPHVVSRKAPFSVASTGTWVISFAVGGSIAGLDTARDTLVNLDAYGRPVPSARFMGGREYELLTANLAPASEEEIEEALPRVLSAGAMLLPSVCGGSGPFPHNKMRWINEPTDPAVRHAAISLYLALMTATCFDLLSAAGSTVVEGPFGRNCLYLQALAAVTGRPVIIVDGSVPTGTAEGAALLTGMEPPPVRDRMFEPTLDLAGYPAEWLRQTAI